MDQAAPEHHEIVIAGSGFSGLGMALQLKADGREDFVVPERAGDLGGAWRGIGSFVPSDHRLTLRAAPAIRSPA
jgi:cation diffusion facilitator CzcD-associated flavoprotein CzcO